MTDHRGLIYNIHRPVVVCFHGKWEIIPHHIGLTEQLRKINLLRLRIIALQASIICADLLHRLYSRLIHVSLINQIAVCIPLHLLCKLVGIDHNIIPQHSKLCLGVVLTAHLLHIPILKRRRMIQ